MLNNAGVLGPLGAPEWMTLDDYRAVCDVNTFGLIDVTMTFLPLVKKSRGRIVNTSSINGRLSVPLCVPYNVSKYGVEAFTDALRSYTLGICGKPTFGSYSVFKKRNRPKI